MAQEQTVPITTPQQTADTAVKNITMSPPPTVPGNPTAGAPTAADLLQYYTSAMYQGFGMPGAQTVHMATPIQGGRMPAPPQMGQMQPQRVAPVSDSLEERRRARAAGWGNILGNALTEVANQQKQQQYMNRVNTIKEYQDALIHRDEARRVLKNYPNDKAALQVLQDSDAIITRMQGDKKESKILADAMPDYADPANDKHAQARKDAARQAYEDDVKGLNNDTDTQRAVSNRADQIAGIPPSVIPNPQAQQGGAPQQQQSVPAGDSTSTVTPHRGQPPPLLAPNVPQGVPQGGTGVGMLAPNAQPDFNPPPTFTPAGAGMQPQGGMTPAQPGQLNVRGVNTPTQGIPPGASPAARKEGTPWSPRYQLPTKLDVTPEYAGALAQHDKYQEALLTKVLPEVEKQATEVYKEKVKQNSQDWRQIQRDVTALYEKYMEWGARTGIAAGHDKAMLDRQAAASAAMIQAAKIRAGVFQDVLLSDPRFAPFAGAYAQRLTGQYAQQVERLTQSNRTIQQTIADLKASLGSDPTKPGSKIKPGSPERAMIENQIRSLNTQLERNNDTIAQIQSTSARVSAMAAMAGGGTGGAQQGGGTSQAPGVGGGRSQSGIEWQKPAAGKAAGLDTSGDYQRWFPLITQVMQQNPQFQNVPGPLIQTLLMLENREGNQYANPQPANAAKGIKQGGQGIFQLIPSNQTKYGVADPYNAESNIRGALSLLSVGMDRGGVKGAIEDFSPKINGKPDPKYVAKALSIYNQLVAAQGGGSSGGAGGAANSTGGGAGGSAQSGGTASATGGQQGTITGEQTALARQAWREAFGGYPEIIVAPIVPLDTSGESEPSSSSSLAGQDAADDAANIDTPN